MLYVVLVLLFIFVFVFLGWRIWAAQPSPKPMKADTYVCPRCNENHCDCHKEEETGS